MAHFVLVHGSMHGAWCWRDLVPALESLGHTAAAPDLPCDDAGAGLEAYADAVAPYVADREPVMLVGHSLGGRTLPVVAARQRVARMIFLCCVPTGLAAVDPTHFAEMVTDAFANAAYDERPDGSRRMRPASAEALFFHDCAPETARWAARQLRFQGPRPLGEPTPLDAWPDAPLDVILTRQDRAVRADWARPEARRWLGEREPLELEGSHSPFLSRPAALAALLDACAR